MTKRREVPWAGKFTLDVEDTVSSLDRLASWSQAHCPGRRIVVGGNVGARVTACLIHEVLQSRTAGHLWTCDADLQGRPCFDVLDLDDAQHCVRELAWPGSAASEPTLGCHPDVLVITGIEQPEASAEDIATGMEWVERWSRQVPADGLIVFNGDDPLLRQLGRRLAAPILWVGRHGDCQEQATFLRHLGAGMALAASGTRFQLPLPGRHHVTAALAALAVGKHQGLSTSEIQTALARFRLPAGCGDLCSTARADIIRDIHNGHLAELRAGLELLRDQPTRGRRIVVAAGLAAAADPQAARKQRCFGEAAVTLCGADMVLSWGTGADYVVAGARQAGMPARQVLADANCEPILARLDRQLAEGDVVLFSGMRAADCQQLIEGLTPARLAFAA